MSRRKKIIISILIIVILGAIIIIPYLPLYFGDLGTTIVDHELEPAFDELTFDRPVDIQKVILQDSINLTRIFVVQQNGIIYEILDYNTSTPTKSAFLDIGGIVSSGSEQGLLGLTFHPNFSTNGYFFVDYTTNSPLRTVIARYMVTDPISGNADLASEKIILEVNQPYGNHNAGQIMFGLDGFLYITLGDGGLANDPDENAQNRKTLLGSILRINIDVPQNQTYTIPETNPYFGNQDEFKEEIYAYGFRNPWRMSQDPETGYIYVGDVGQNDLEEIDLIIPDNASKNYGWDKKEGRDCFLSLSCDGDYIDPITQYSHSEGISVTGGYVYRGSMLTDLRGHYLYGDYWSGKIWSLLFDGEQATETKFIGQFEIKISTFGLDWNDELLICDYEDGVIYRLIQVI